MRGREERTSLRCAACVVVVSLSRTTHSQVSFFVRSPIRQAQGDKIHSSFFYALPSYDPCFPRYFFRLDSRA